MEAAGTGCKHHSSSVFLGRKTNDGASNTTASPFTRRQALVNMAGEYPGARPATGDTTEPRCSVGGPWNAVERHLSAVSTTGPGCTLAVGSTTL